MKYWFFKWDPLHFTSHQRAFFEEARQEHVFSVLELDLYADDLLFNNTMAEVLHHSSGTTSCLVKFGSSLELGNCRDHHFEVQHLSWRNPRLHMVLSFVSSQC